MLPWPLYTWHLHTSNHEVTWHATKSACRVLMDPAALHLCEQVPMEPISINWCWALRVLALGRGLSLLCIGNAEVVPLLQKLVLNQLTATVFRGHATISMSHACFGPRAGTKVADPLQEWVMGQPGMFELSNCTVCRSTRCLLIVQGRRWQRRCGNVCGRRRASPAPSASPPIACWPRCVHDSSREFKPK